jgi:hypothetical protein
MAAATAAGFGAVRSDKDRKKSNQEDELHRVSDSWAGAADPHKLLQLAPIGFRRRRAVD